MIDISEACFIDVNCLVRTSLNAGIASFTVTLVDVDFLVFDLRLIIIRKIPFRRNRTSICCAASCDLLNFSMLMICTS